MSEIKKIGMYSTDEILKHLTEGEGRGFLVRSMYDAIYFKIEELETQLQQKENIIKEVRKKLKELVEDDGTFIGEIDCLRKKELLEILDKESQV